MNRFCYLKDCDNYHSCHGDIDCIMEYSKIMQDACKNIIMHYEGNSLFKIQSDNKTIHSI